MPIDLRSVWVIPLSLQTSAVIHGFRARLQSAPAEHSLVVVVVVMVSNGGWMFVLALVFVSLQMVVQRS